MGFKLCFPLRSYHFRLSLQWPSVAPGERQGRAEEGRCFLPVFGKGRGGDASGEGGVVAFGSQDALPDWLPSCGVSLLYSLGPQGPLPSVAAPASPWGLGPSLEHWEDTFGEQKGTFPVLR